MMCTMTAGTISVSAQAAHGTRAKLEAMRPLFRAERRRAQAMRGEERWDVRGLTGRESAARRTQLRMHQALLRERGQLVDSLETLVRYGVRAELTERGWDHDWPPLPQQAQLAGRRPGSRDGGWPETVSVRLPADMVTTVWAACWHTSADAMAALRDWRDRWPDKLPGPSLRTPEEEAAYAEYQLLAAQVTTAGEIWRAGITRGITTRHTLRERLLTAGLITAEDVPPFEDDQADEQPATVTAAPIPAPTTAPEPRPRRRRLAVPPADRTAQAE